MSLPDGFTLRRASTADLDILVAQRRAMFRDVHRKSDALLDSMSTKFRAWALEHMNAGDYLAWLVDAADGSVAAGAALWLMDWPPHVIGVNAQRGNILNVYTADDFRKRGLARFLMETVLAWCRENSVDIVILHASPFGRSLYESMGFKPTNEMRLEM
jgi:GNAT superfamily N-acetyltransferase